MYSFTVTKRLDLCVASLKFGLLVARLAIPIRLAHLSLPTVGNFKPGSLRARSILFVHY